MNLVQILLSFIFPPRTEEVVVSSLTPTTLSQLRNTRTSPYGYILFHYEDTHIRALVWEAKYHRNTKAFMLMGMEIAHALLANYTLPHETVLVVPIPLSKKRTHERGYNQIHEVLKCARLHKKVSEHFEVATDLLIRVRETIPQTQLSRKARLTNLSGAFAVSETERKRLAHTTVVLVDDVTTTGTTLDEARRTLLRAGAHAVYTLSFAG